MSKVSVIVPNYNHAGFLPERLDSILAQTRQPDEIIFLDDASADNSREILRQYAVRHPDLITCHFNDENSGSPFVQWKKGVGLANGEFIWIAESDDVADPRFLEELVPMLDENPKAGIAYCESYMIGPEGENLGDLQYRTDELDTDHWKSPYTNDGRLECSSYMVWKNTIPNASGVLFRKEAYGDVGDMPLSFRLCGDWLVWVKMLKNFDICYTPKVLNSFRHHSVSVRDTTKREAFDDETWRVQNFIIKEFDAPLKSVIDVLDARLQVLDKYSPCFDVALRPDELIDRFKHKLDAFYGELDEEQKAAFMKERNVYLPLAKRLVDYGNKASFLGQRKLARHYYSGSLRYDKTNPRVYLYAASTYIPWVRGLVSFFSRKAHTLS